MCSYYSEFRMARKMPFCCEKTSRGCIIFLLTCVSIRAHTKPKARRNARPKGGHYEDRRLWIRPNRYASQLVKSLLPE